MTHLTSVFGVRSSHALDEEVYRPEMKDVQRSAVVEGRTRGKLTTPCAGTAFLVRIRECVRRERSVGKRIVITAFGSFGDVNPCVGLALGLKQRGHSPVIATLKPQY